MNSDEERALEEQALREIQAERAAAEMEEDEDEEEENEEEKMKSENKKAAMINAANDLKSSVSNLPWVELLDLSARPFEVRNPEDDLSRETLFYSVTLEAVKAGRLKLEELKVPHRRPADYFAEMVKTDDHMKKIKESLVFEKQKMEAYQMRRSEQDQKKFAKKVQAAKLKEKRDSKMEHDKAVSKWRDGNKGAGKDTTVEDFQKHFNKDAGGGGGGKNRKREGKDKKYGMLGQPARLKKRNDSKSASDMRDFKGFKKGGFKKGGSSPTPSTHSRGRTKQKKPNRPGKEARAAKRQRTS
jgi:rRNA-processing protein EBP2